MVHNRLWPVFLILTVLSGLLAPRRSSGAVKYRVLHAFGNSGDGAGILAGLALDDNGNPYGTTTGGGARCPGFTPRFWALTWASRFRHHQSPRFRSRPCDHRP